MTTIKLKYECTTIDGKCHWNKKKCIDPDQTTLEANVCPYLKATRTNPHNPIEQWAKEMHKTKQPKQINLKQWR
jgi:hypothetical protein